MSETTNKLTEEEQKELDALYEIDEPTPEDELRLAELEIKAGEPKETNEVSTEESNAVDTVEVTEEITTEETTSAVEESNEKEVQSDEQTVILSDPMNDDEEKIVKTYTIEKIKPKDDYNQLWGVYESQLSNGLGCITKCFSLDLGKKLKVGDLIELPADACVTVRQSYRKISDDDNNTKPATFDWLHF